MNRPARTLEELRAHAVLFWPDELRDQVASVSILPLLLKTQGKFLGVLELSDDEPEAWKRNVDTHPLMPANLFLKHLMVLSDIGRETLSKLIPLNRFYPDGIMNYIWHEQQYTYHFQRYSEAKPVTNKVLKIEPADLTKGHALTPHIEDVTMLLLHAASSIENTLPNDEKDRCMVGTLMEKNPEQLKRFVSENYIRVSTQTRGAKSNALGQIAQNFVKSILQAELPDWSIKSGRIPGISHDDAGTETSFDMVAKSPGNKYFAIEVAFQVTTNSVIERKAGQAQARAHILHEAGHHICYVLDGAGNLNFRTRASQIIMQHSDCTVALSQSEIKELAAYMRQAAMQSD